MTEMSKLHWTDTPNGSGTIPGIMSIRAPPTGLGIDRKNDKLIGITKSEVSERYIVKLQRDRERNNREMFKCLDNLPIKIRQVSNDGTNQDNTGYSTSRDGSIYGALGMFDKRSQYGTLYSPILSHDSPPPPSLASSRLSTGCQHSTVLPVCNKCNKPNRTKRKPNQSQRHSTPDFVKSNSTMTDKDSTRSLDAFDTYAKGKIQNVFTSSLPHIRSAGFQGHAVLSKNSKYSRRKYAFGQSEEIEVQKNKRTSEQIKQYQFMNSSLVAGRTINTMGGKHNKLPPLLHMDHQSNRDAETFAINSVQFYNEPSVDLPSSRVNEHVHRFNEHISQIMPDESSPIVVPLVPMHSFVSDYYPGEEQEQHDAENITKYGDDKHVTLEDHQGSQYEKHHQSVPTTERDAGLHRLTDSGIKQETQSGRIQENITDRHYANTIQRDDIIDKRTNKQSDDKTSGSLFYYGQIHDISQKPHSTGVSDLKQNRDENMKDSLTRHSNNNNVALVPNDFTQTEAHQRENNGRWVHPTTIRKQDSLQKMMKNKDCLSFNDVSTLPSKHNMHGKDAQSHTIHDNDNTQSLQNVQTPYISGSKVPLVVDRSLKHADGNASSNNLDKNVSIRHEVGSDMMNATDGKSNETRSEDDVSSSSGSDSGSCMNVNDSNAVHKTTVPISDKANDLPNDIGKGMSDENVQLKTQNNDNEVSLDALTTSKLIGNLQSQDSSETESNCELSSSRSYVDDGVGNLQDDHTSSSSPQRYDNGHQREQSNIKQGSITLISEQKQHDNNQTADDTRDATNESVYSDETGLGKAFLTTFE